MPSKKEEALKMYLANTSTQRQIALHLGLTERTIYNWIRNNAWDQLRHTAAPVRDADDICNELLQLQAKIAAREPGKRYPTPQEAEITLTLITSLTETNQQPTASQSARVLNNFRQFIAPRVDDNMARTIATVSEEFLRDQAKKENQPYHPKESHDTM